MYMKNNELNGLLDVVKDTALKVGGFLAAPPAAKAAIVAKAAAGISTNAAKAVSPPSPVAGPMPPTLGPLPTESERQPATWEDLFGKVFRPMALAAVKSAAPGEQSQTASAGHAQNRDAPKQIVPYEASGGVVGPLGVPATQPSINYQAPPAPVYVTLPPQSSLPTWALPAGIAVAALFLLGRK